MEKVQKDFKMAIVIQGIIAMENLKVWENIFGKMVIFIKENLLMD
jgi:hypothetical protein